MIPTKYNPRPDLVEKAKAIVPKVIETLDHQEQYPGQAVACTVVLEGPSRNGAPTVFDRIHRVEGRYFLEYFTQNKPGTKEKPKQTIAEITP